MKKIKKYIIISVCIIIAIFISFFLGCIGSDEYCSLWIENKTDDVLSVYITGKINKTYKFIEGNTSLHVRLVENIAGKEITKASKYIETISVLTPLDNTLLLYLDCAEKIDKKVIFTGRAYWFLFQINEEDFGLGITKNMEFSNQDIENNLKEETTQ